MTTIEDTDNTKQKVPIIIKICVVFISVYGIIGFLLYAAASAYQFSNSQFLQNRTINNIVYNNLVIYAYINAVLYFGIIVSAFLIKKLKKSGLFLLFFVFTGIIGCSIFFEDNILISNVIAGVIIISLISFFYKKFN